MEGRGGREGKVEGFPLVMLSRFLKILLGISKILSEYFMILK